MIAWNPSPENPSADRGDCFVATGAAIAMAIAAGATAGSAAYSAHRQASAANDAARMQTDAANHAADVGKQSNDDALKFQREQAAADAARFESSQRANYNQYLARYNAVRGFAGSSGLNLPDAPDYASATGSGGPASGGADPKAVAFIRDYQSKNNPTSTPADLVKAAQAAGVNITPYMYGQTPSNNEVSVGGQKFKIKGGEDGPNPSWYFGGNDSAPGAGTMAPTTGQYLPSSVASYLPQGAPVTAALQTPQLQRPQDFRLRGVSSYLGGR